MPGQRPRLALTAGEPAGIGPDLCLHLSRYLADHDTGCDIVCLADHNLLEARAEQLGISLHESPVFRIEHLPLARPCAAGRLDVRNAAHVLSMLGRAADGCLSGEFAGVVTAPVQKSVINDAGIAFTGHTEFFADRCGGPHPVMMLVADSLKVALATTHLPVSAVSAAITADVLDSTLRIVDADLRRLWRLPRPRIAVCGLNPHAGEGGHLGREEIDVIAPAITRARAAGIDATGPWPADTIFVPRNLQHHDVVLAMFHDQGLPTLKYAGFGSAVNVTLGLPILRTSVDHGTALDLAGTGKADAGSLEAAVQLAARIATGRIAT
ncbi:MAG: 4-hydroxythreonine-4-phosphate dehydrogenase PdxA [Pseudomonadota bacterium]|jgi:4-hydroxythreonine-4-phosphate dehydrogenase